jgi:hypothetical protein
LDPFLLKKIVTQLPDTCLLSGAPHIVLTGNGREFCIRVEEDLNAMLSLLKIVLGKRLTAVKKGLIMTLPT